MGLRPPPPQRNQGLISGQITDLIDIDYETLVLLLGVAGAGASWVLYQAVLTKGRRAFRAEKQGETGEEGDMASLLSFIEYGLEEFEEKIEALGQQEEEDNKSETWISNLVKEYAKVKKEAEQEMEEEEEEQNEDVELEDLEPPLLDPMWGLNLTNTTRTKRSSEDEGPSPNKIEQDGSNSQCMLGVWRCLSGVLESGVMHIDRPGGLM